MSTSFLPSRTQLPIRIRDRCEFISNDWLAAAHGFLSPRVAQYQASLKDVRIAICETYTNCPPHLGFDNNVGTIHFVIENGQLDVGYGEVHDPNMRVGADYNQSQVIATGVYERLPERQKRLQRELLHRHGNVFELGGKGFQGIPRDALGVLAGIHDHLAKRTSTNPDIDHRINHLGLRKHVEEIHEQGYTVIERVISEKFVEELVEDVERLLLENSKGHPTAAMLMARGPLWEEVASHPSIHAIAQSMLGVDCILAQSIAFKKRAGQDTHQLHNDPPHPQTGDVCCNVTSIWALTEFDEHAGPTLVVPGSHKLNRPPDKDAQGKTKKLVMPRGSVAMWHGSLWHGAAIRDSEGERLSLHNTYLRRWVRPWDSYLEIDPEILERNAPVITTLAGVDDLMGKNTFDGIDFKRLA